MNYLNGFVNTGADDELIKSIPTENISEDLVKAMNKAGLVQKQVVVNGKHGQYTKMAWVKSGEASKGSSKKEPTSETPKFISSIKLSTKVGKTIEYEGKTFTCVDAYTSTGARDKMVSFKSEDGCEINARLKGKNHENYRPEDELNNSNIPAGSGTISYRDKDRKQVKSWKTY